MTLIIHVSYGEFLKTLVFSDRIEKRNLVLVFQGWKMTTGHYSYLITLQVFRKTAHLKGVGRFLCLGGGGGGGQCLAQKTFPRLAKNAFPEISAWKS